MIRAIAYFLIFLAGGIGAFAFGADDLSEDAVMHELHLYTRNTVQFNQYFQDNGRDEYLRANQQFIKAMNEFTGLPQKDISETMNAYFPQSSLGKKFIDAAEARYRALEMENIDTLTSFEQRFKNLLDHNKANEPFLFSEGQAVRQAMQKWTPAEKAMAGVQQKMLNLELYVSELDAEIANRIRVRARRGRAVREEMTTQIERLKVQRTRLFQQQEKYSLAIKFDSSEKAQIAKRYARWLRLVSDTVMADSTHSVLLSVLNAKFPAHNKGSGVVGTGHARE